MDVLIAICMVLLAVILILNIIMIINSKKMPDHTNNTEDIKAYIDETNRNNRIEMNATVTNSVKNMAELLAEKQENSDNAQIKRLEQLEHRLSGFSSNNEIQLNNIREAVEKRLEYIQRDNNSKLDEMRNLVDKELQKTIDAKMTQSFALVNQRLEQVYRGLGEMQSLAAGVGDLKKVLSNVKTRGMLGEIQLGAILKEILSPEQYQENVVTNKNTRNPVEYAIKLPNDNNSFVYLPIDSKFPADTYHAVLTAQGNGNKEEINAAVKNLVSTMKNEAKDIHNKYINPPATTDFAIMFLPCEGLYAEAVSRGLVETLQREYKVNIAGPSTMAALLNSLQMGFKTLAVQQRSTEVWQVLNSVKTEFDNFEEVLTQTQRRITQVNSDLDKLVGVRTRQIQRRLADLSNTDIGD